MQRNGSKFTIKAILQRMKLFKLLLVMSHTHLPCLSSTRMTSDSKFKWMFQILLKALTWTCCLNVCGEGFWCLYLVELQFSTDFTHIPKISFKSDNISAKLFILPSKINIPKPIYCFVDRTQNSKPYGYIQMKNPAWFCKSFIF